MKYKIEIMTLTPVHIGSGEEIQKNVTYLHFRNEDAVAVLSPPKVFQTIKKVTGQDDEDIINQWVSIVNKRQNLLELLKIRQSNIKAKEISTRVINTQKTFPNGNIKCQIHLGSQLQPAIPGSSLKGSIRTAILNDLIRTNSRFAQNEKNLASFRGGRTRYSDGALQAHYLAPQKGRNDRLDPKKDLLRLLRIGDAFFNTSTSLVKSMVVNEFHSGWDIKKPLSSFFEAIPENESSFFYIQIPDDLKEHKGTKSHFYDLAKFKYYNIQYLFKVLNENTLNQLDEEIGFWEDENNPIAIGSYLEDLEQIEMEAKKCSENECIIRVGAGSGWDYMTGRWAKGKDKNGNFILSERSWNNLKNALNRGKYSGDISFPKTRKLIEGGQPLGFVKLSVQI